MATRAEKYLIEKFQVKRFRSLLDTTITVAPDTTTVICGANNIGKTNVLRALNVFFNHHKGDVDYSPEEDLPKHIFEGSRGGGTNTQLIGTFRRQTDGKETVLSIKHTLDGFPTYLINRKTVSEAEAQKILSSVRFYFIEANNVDTPEIIAEILAEDILKELDKQRGDNRDKPLRKLTEFIEASADSIAKIATKLNKKFGDYVANDPILSNKILDIGFAEFERLRDAVKDMVSISVSDGGQRDMAFKGSGAQRAVLMAMMDFVADSARSPVIWGIDEPEAFLQPKLQRQMAEKLRELSAKESHSVIITTHSAHMIELQNTKHTHLFDVSVTEKVYDRRRGTKFYELDAKPEKFSNESSKAIAIKDHLGIEANDGWRLMPHNVLVEGEEDRKYLEAYFQIAGLPSPHFIVCGGASKAKGFLQFFNSFADELTYKPVIRCVFDEDRSGRDASSAIAKKSYSNLDVSVVRLPRFTGDTKNIAREEWEIEDFVEPDLMFAAVNSLLRKEKYSIVDSRQREERSELAHRGTQILHYAEECVRARNPNSEPIQLDNEGRKKQICWLAVKTAEQKLNEFSVSKTQKAFLKSLIE